MLNLRSKAGDFGFYAGLDATARQAELSKIREQGKLDHPVERMVKLDKSAVDQEKRTVTFAASSEEPVDQWWGREILSHEKKAVRMDRLRASAPLLVNHDTNDQVGVVETAKIEGKRIMVQVRFGKSARAEEIFQDVIDEIRPNVSIGYRIHAMQDITTKEDQAQTYKVIDWEPAEITIASIPADFKQSGLGRELDNLSLREEKTMLNPEQYAALLAKRTAGQQLTAEEMAGITAFEAANPGSRTAPATLPVVAPVAAAAPSAVDVSAVVQTALNQDRQRTQAIDDLAARFGQGVTDLDKHVRTAKQQNLTPDQFGKQLLEMRGSAAPQPATQSSVLALKASDMVNYSVLKALEEGKRGRLTGLEKEVQEEMVRMGHAPERGGVRVPLHLLMRTMSAGTASAGGVLIETEQMGMVDLLRNRTLAVSMGVRVLDGLTGDISFKRMTADGSVYWVGESVDTTAGTPSLGEINGTMKTVSGRFPLTRKLQKQTGGAAENVARESLSKALALAVDLAILAGSGSAAQPLGIGNVSGIGSVSGTSLAWAGILEMESDVASANADVSTMGMITTPTVKALLKQRTQVAGGTTPPFIWTGGKVNDYRAEATMQMEAGSAIFGDFAQALLALWGVPEFTLIDQGDGYKNGEKEVMAFQDCDVLVLQAGAFTKATSIT